MTRRPKWWPWLTLRFAPLPLLALLGVAMALVGCQEGTSWTMTVSDTRGKCWNMLSDPDSKGTRIRYAVLAPFGRKLGLVAGRRVTFEAAVTTRKDCSNAVLLVEPVR